MSDGWTWMITDEQQNSPGGTNEDSPPIHRWVARQDVVLSPGGTKESCGETFSFAPGGACDVFDAIDPAMNRWAIFGCPCETKTTGGLEK